MSLRWLNFSGIPASGAPFGTDLDPATGYLRDTDDLYSKIVAYSDFEGKERLLEITDEDPQAKEFVELHDSLSDHDRESVKKTFHKLIMPKGRFCSRCHTEEDKSYLPFRKLGFSDRRVQDLTNLNIIGLVQKYRDFYLPSLMKSEQSLPSVDEMAGPTESKPARSKDSGAMHKDPRDWWRKTYDAPSGGAKQK
jgi:hypothetical protein